MVQPTSVNYIRPQGNANVRVYDDGETYGFYYNGSSNQYGGYFVTSSATSPTSAVVGFSDVAGNETKGYLGYNGTYTSQGISVDGSAVYGVVDDKNRAAVFGRTTKDANVAAIIGYSTAWTAGYYYSYDNATQSHSGLYSQLENVIDKTDDSSPGYQTAVKGYSEYNVDPPNNRGYTIGGAFYSMGHEQDSRGIDTYAFSKGAGTVSYGIRAEVDTAETTYGILVKSGTAGNTSTCYGVLSMARTSDGIGILGLGSGLSTIYSSWNGDGVIGGSSNGYGVLGYYYDGTSTDNHYGVLGYSENYANYFRHSETATSGTNKNQSAVYAFRTRDSQNDGSSYSKSGTNEAIQGYNVWGDHYTFGVSGHCNNYTTQSGGVLGSEKDGTYWGSLGYYASDYSTYGGYFTSYTSGAGKSNNITGVGIGSYGGVAGAWFRGEVYGTITKGKLFAQYVDGKTYTNDVIVQLSDNGENERIPTYVTTSTTADIYMRGTGKLNNGKAVISFDTKYQNLISDKEPVIVTVTPIGETKGIHLTKLKSSGFEVAENEAGKGNIQFTWIAVGIRKGYEDPKNPKEILSNDFDNHIEGFMFNENNLKESGKPMWWDGKSIRYDNPPKEKRIKKSEEHKSIEKNYKEPIKDKNKRDFKETQSFQK